MTVRAHYMPANPPAAVRKVFVYSFLVRRRPLPEWICPRVIEHAPCVRVVTNLDIRAPLAEELNFRAEIVSEVYHARS